MIKCPDCKTNHNLVYLGTQYMCLMCGGKTFLKEDVERGLIEFINKNEVDADD